MVHLGLREPEDYGTTYGEMDAAKRPMSRRGKAAVAAGAVAGLVVGGALFGRALDHELDQQERQGEEQRQELIDAGWTPGDPMIDGDGVLLPPKETVGEGAGEKVPESTTTTQVQEPTIPLPPQGDN